MTQEPYASADRVFWIVDNGSSHRGQKAVDRLAKQYPNAIMVHTQSTRPGSTRSRSTSPSCNGKWSRPTTSPNDAVTERLSAFEARYNQTARPFRWKFTTTDLTELLARLDNHKPVPAHDPVQPRAA